MTPSAAIHEFIGVMGQWLNAHPVLQAAVTGFVAGLVLSIPVGPVNLTIMNEGARRGFLWAAMIGLGAVVMEAIYCALAFTGFASFFTQGLVKAAMEVFSFGFMLYLGIKFMVSPSISKNSDLEQRLEQRLHPHSAFWTGFVRVMGNPGVFLFWIVLAANFISRGWVDPNLAGKFSCVGGMSLGAGLWFAALSWMVSFRRKKFSEKTLLRMERGSGIVLVSFACLHGAHLIWEMAKHRQAIGH